MVRTERCRRLMDGSPDRGPVVYWMDRDQRVHDNWAILYAQQTALAYKVPLIVVYSLAPRYLQAGIRDYDFLLRGLQQVEKELSLWNIPFFLLLGNPGITMPAFLSRKSFAALIADFSPLRLHREWKEAVKEMIRIPFFEVDAHNIVPCWEASTKLEWSAYTLRPKIQRLLPLYLEEFPRMIRHPYSWKEWTAETDVSEAVTSLQVALKASPSESPLPGEKAARLVLDKFLRERLGSYAERRNDPLAGVQSGLSPYLHFGQISAQRIALEVKAHHGDRDSTGAFLEELIVRKELADNFCFYNPQYDSMEGFPDWAKKTLQDHAHDRREYVYQADQFEKALTHDPLWNAAQNEMVRTGKMHSYLRMYWAKKILEWSPSPEEALETAIRLNDRYELDGRDPNGYAGIAWSIGGVHDRAWGERKIFGKIRFMNAEGCRRKFDVGKYIQSQIPSPKK